MKHLEIAFPTQPAGLMAGLLGARRSVVGYAGLLATALATGWTAHTAWQTWQARQQLDIARHAVDSALRQASGARSTERMPKTAEAGGQQAAWAELASQLNMPWHALLTSLEQATPDDVALVSIAPDLRAGHVRVLAEARTLPPLLAYAQRLQSTPPVQSVALARHETMEQDPQHPVRLQLNLRLQGRAGAAR